MFKTAITAATFAAIAGMSHANLSILDLPQQAEAATFALEQTLQTTEEVATYCEWATIYDFYGNWVTVWQCY